MVETTIGNFKIDYKHKFYIIEIMDKVKFLISNLMLTETKELYFI